MICSGDKWIVLGGFFFFLLPSLSLFSIVLKFKVLLPIFYHEIFQSTGSWKDHTVNPKSQFLYIQCVSVNCGPLWYSDCAIICPSEHFLWLLALLAPSHLWVLPCSLASEMWNVHLVRFLPPVWILHVSSKPGSFYWRMVRRGHNLGCRVAHCCWVVTASKAFQ